MTVYKDEELVKDSYYDMNQYLREKRIAEVVKYIRKMPVLDIGCGEGESTALLTQLLGAHFKYIVGIDNDAEQIEKAKKAKPDLLFQCAEVHEMPRFHTIHCGHVIEHVKNPIGFLRACHSRLSDHGRIIVTTPNARSLHKRVGDWMGLSVPYGFSHTDNEQGHRYVFDMILLEAFLRIQQFNIIHKQGLMLKPFPSSMMWDLFDVKILDAFWEMGHDPKLIDYCSSIMIVGEKRP